MSDARAWDNETDLVIVGSGAGGLCAALLAGSRGSDAIVLEKEKVIGGSTARSGGAIWVPNNPLMQREGISDTIMEACQYAHSCVVEYSSAATAERIDAYLESGPEMLSFMEAQGIVLRRCEGYSDYYDDRPGGCSRGRAVEAELYDSRKLGAWSPKLNRYAAFAMPVCVSEFPDLSNARTTWRGKIAAARLGWRLLLQKLRGGAPILAQGSAIQGRMLRKVIDQKVPIHLGSPVRELVTENGRVVGVIARMDGSDVAIKARQGVLVNAGGFAFNERLREVYLPPSQKSTEFSLGNPGDTGDLLQSVIDLGAALDQMDEAWWLVSSRLPNGIPVSHTADLSKPHCILVDSQGDRYLDEAMSYQELGQVIIAHDKTVQAIPSWAIFDARHRANYSWGMAMPGSTPQEWIDTGYLIRAETLDELAEICKIPAGRLQKTVARFNGFARAGRDTDFGRGNRAYERLWGDPSNKPNPSLGTIEKGPFYAVRISVGDVGTCGGMVTDVDGRVLRTDGAPIPGLYACGNAAASCFGRSYPGPGITLGQSFIFGYRAARSALGVNI